MAYKQPVTANNLEAAWALRKKPGALYRKLRDLEDNAGPSKDVGKAEHLIESLTDKESAQEAYEEAAGAYSELLEEAMDAPKDYLDLRTLQSCKKQLALAGSLAREENYQLPVEINGELTAINLKVLHGGDAGKVSITVQTEQYGQITAKFSLKEQSISGYIACDTKEGVEWLQGREEDMKNALAAAGENGQERKTGNIAVMYSKGINGDDYTREDTDGSTGGQTAELYRIAKTFITALTA